MKKLSPTTTPVTPLHLTSPRDDILSMKSSLPLPDLHYVDVAAQAELMLATQRWPLLARLAGNPSSGREDT